MHLREIHHLVLYTGKWMYFNDLKAARTSDDGWTGKSLTVYGRTEETHFLEVADFELEIAEYSAETFPHFENDEMGLVFGYLEKLEESKKSPLISSTIPVTEQDFENLRNCLLHWSTVDGCLLRFALSLYGLDLGEYTHEDDKWPNETKLQIVGFKYFLESVQK